MMIRQSTEIFSHENLFFLISSDFMILVRYLWFLLIENNMEINPVKVGFILWNSPFMLELYDSLRKRRRDLL